MQRINIIYWILLFCSFFFMSKGYFDNLLVVHRKLKGYVCYFLLIFGTSMTSIILISKHTRDKRNTDEPSFSIEKWLHQQTNSLCEYFFIWRSFLFNQLSLESFRRDKKKPNHILRSFLLLFFLNDIKWKKIIFYLLHFVL
jgi:hypothetical protein